MCVYVDAWIISIAYSEKILLLFYFYCTLFVEASIGTDERLLETIYVRYVGITYFFQYVNLSN